MKKILILANNDVGLYKFRKELIERLVEEGNKVFISLPIGSYVPKLESLGCEFIETPINRRGKNPFDDLKLFLMYRKILKIIKPHIVLTYTIKPNVYGGLACRVLKKPYIANITGLGTAVESGGLIQKTTLFLYKIGLRKADCVFFQNETNKAFFTDNKIVESKTKLIPGSGVNLEKYSFEEYPNNDNLIIFLFIGRIMKTKGIEELLQAVKVIKQKFSNVQFNLIGTHEEEYEEEIIDLEKNEIIKYHGRQNNVHAFIKESHAIINPSYHEGMSNVLLESASTGRPILASNIPGCKEIFDQGISGVGFEVKNVHSLVHAIEKFINLSYEEKKKMGIAGRRKVENEFDRNIVINSYLDEINNAIED